MKGILVGTIALLASTMFAGTAVAGDVLCVEAFEGDVARVCTGYTDDASKRALCFGQFESVDGVSVWTVVCVGDDNCPVYVDPVVGLNQQRCLPDVLGATNVVYDVAVAVLP